MIDGVKIDVPNLSGVEWQENDLLDFFTYTNTNTGELKDGTLTARYNGLTFIVTQSNKAPNLKYCSLRGSLHKYYNKGETNANDFTIDQLKTVINDLREKFSIDPKTARLRNVEFGVNIRTPETAKAIINNLVAYNNNPFADFKVNGKKIGKGIGKQRYKLKVYDKGKQESMPVSNLMRVEIAIKKMHYLKKYRIETLGDLLKLDKVQPLGSLLVDHWQGAIYYDKQIKWKRLTDFERKKLLYYAAPRNWAEFDRKQRLRAKAHFQEIVNHFGTTSTHTETGNLIAKKWNELTAVICPRLNHDFKENESLKMSTFEPLECTVKMYPNQPNQKNKKMTQKTHQKKPTISTPRSDPEKGKFCRTCAKDISGKKANALYCSKKCNNSYQALQRKKQRHYIKMSETVKLSELLKNLHRSRLWLLVEYRDSGISEAVNLQQNEINAPYSWARKVIKVTEINTGVTLTSTRAKTLINRISKFNLKNN